MWKSATLGSVFLAVVLGGVAVTGEEASAASAAAAKPVGVQSYFTETWIEPGDYAQPRAWCAVGEVATGGGFIFGTGDWTTFAAGGKVLRGYLWYNQGLERWSYGGLAVNNNSTVTRLMVVVNCVEGFTSEPWLLPSEL